MTAIVDPVHIPLRGIHLPSPIGWWPPAPGWWLLLAMAVILIGGLLWLRRRFTKPNIRKTALQELTRLQNDQDVPTAERIRQLSLLLRRVCLSAYPRKDSASLVGAAWLQFLDGPLGDQRFSRGPGTVLIDAPYRPNATVDFDGLYALCREWAMALPMRPL